MQRHCERKSFDEMSIGQVFRTEFAVVASAAGITDTRELIAGAGLSVHALCGVTEACRTGSSVRVHLPPLVTVAIELCSSSRNHRLSLELCGHVHVCIQAYSCTARARTCTCTSRMLHFAVSLF